MGMIVTVCPVTGNRIPTGIETDRDTFARISSMTSRVWCPHCKGEHEWSTENAFLSDNRVSREPDPA